MNGGEGQEMGMKEREGKDKKGTAGSKQEKRDQGKRRRTWEGIKNGVCVPYCQSALLATIYRLAP